MRFMQISIDGSAGYVQPLDKITEACAAEFDGLEYWEVDDAVTFTLIEMTQEEYDKLPEFEGW